MNDKEKRTRIHGENSASHDTCIICGDKNPFGLKLKFEFPPDGSISSEFMCKFVYEGYKGFLQGGVAAALLDGAMTNCLFSHGFSAFTAELDLKYKKPVRCGSKIRISARIDRSYSPLHLLSGSISQDGAEAVTAKGKFMESPLLKAVKT